jgi:hypothetical protein
LPDQFLHIYLIYPFMKLVPSFLAVAILCCVASVYSCKKPFKDGVGLYSTKQYHVQQIEANGDTVLFGTAQIGASMADNNYLTWNGISFHTDFISDSLVTYIHDTFTTVYSVVYTLSYQPKKDHIDVVGNNMIWHSF